MDWAREPLDDASRAAIARGRWVRFPEATVVAVAEAWNAGMTTAHMADDLRCSPASLRILIGRLTQIGVKLRKASQSGSVARSRRPSPPPAVATPEAFARPAALRRFSWDAATDKGA